MLLKVFKEKEAAIRQYKINAARYALSREAIGIVEDTQGGYNFLIDSKPILLLTTYLIDSIQVSSQKLLRMMCDALQYDTWILYNMIK